MSARNDYPWLADVADDRSAMTKYRGPIARDALAEIDRLRRWKDEATIVLGYWDIAFERSGVTGLIGCFKPTLMADEIGRLRGDLARMTARYDRVVYLLEAEHGDCDYPGCEITATCNPKGTT